MLLRGFNETGCLNHTFDKQWGTALGELETNEPTVSRRGLLF